MATYRISETGYEGQEKTVRGRATDDNGDAYQQADLTSLKFDAVHGQDTATKITYTHDGGATADDVALAVTSDNPPAEGEIYVSDTLLTTEGWSAVDATGWNWKVVFPRTLFTRAGDTVRIEIFATPSAAGATQIVFAVIEIYVEVIHGS